MTKDEMLEMYSPTQSKTNNYEEAQRRIKEAMEKGEKYVYLPREEYKNEFTWYATWDTISQLMHDGFHIDVMWKPSEYWSVEWGWEDWEFEKAEKANEEEERQFEETLKKLHKTLHPNEEQSV